MQPIKLLIIEDDTTSQLMLKGILSMHKLTIVGTGEEGLEAAKNGHDLIILDINLPGIDGYEACRQLRQSEQTKLTPIIFLTTCSDLNDRLQAYGVGGNDYISKPFDATELVSKIDFHCELVEKHKQTNNDISNARRLLMEVQTSAAKIQSISRFIQTTLFCHDIDSLYRQFFRTANEIGLDCILRIESSAGTKTRSSCDGISTLEQEILDMSGNMKHIHTFGQDRAIYRWRHAAMLTRKVSDMIDILAIFMDALEAGIKAVDNESKLLQKVEELESNNSEVRSRVSDLFHIMRADIKGAILSLGMISVLDIDDEDKLNDLIDNFSQRIDLELQQLDKNNSVMQQLVTDLRTPPPELQALLDDDSDEGEGVMLF
ncbi:MAG: response regulator transcription factor [Candidatus Polarisedimenticolaceae bacterium]|nr:response regulator transcription factor [Candidatus Polarisedimenticolaceae bacterium]